MLVMQGWAGHASQTHKGSEPHLTAFAIYPRSLGLTPKLPCRGAAGSLSGCQRQGRFYCIGVGWAGSVTEKRR